MDENLDNKDLPHVQIALTEKGIEIVGCEGAVLIIDNYLINPEENPEYIKMGILMNDEDGKQFLRTAYDSSTVEPKEG